MFERILIGVDFTPCSDLALDVARTHFPGAQRRLVHAAPLLPTMTSALDLLESSAGDDDGLERDRADLDDLRLADETAQFARGHPAEALLAEAVAWGADLIVVGTHGRRGVDHVLFGSVAERVVRDAAVPVLTVGRRTAPAADAEPASGHVLKLTTTA